MSDDLSYEGSIDLDKRISDLGYELAPKDTYDVGARKSPDSFLDSLRRSRSGDGIARGRSARKYGMNDISSMVEEISYNNRTIEHAVRREVLGTKNDWKSKVSYALTHFGSKSDMPVENIFEEQIGRVRSVDDMLSSYNAQLDQRIDRLQKRHQILVGAAVEKYENNSVLKTGLQEKKSLLDDLSQSVDALGNDDLAMAERMKYMGIMRELRRDISHGVHNVNRNGNYLTLLRREMPIIESLSQVSDAYSFSMKEISDNTEILTTHLQSVVPLYLDVLRSEAGVGRLQGEVQKLFGYTSNLSGAVQAGKQRIVTGGEEHGLVHLEFDRIERDLDGALTDVEEATFGQLDRLENQLYTKHTDERRLK
ncbi:MAG: hypothetical protein ACI83O_000244 [Patescibacteria group bacterium]|jgi:hypothetical protein